MFANAGYISKQPFFDSVFPNFANTINEDVENEQIVSFELGYGLRHRFIDANVNLYSINWSNRWLSRSVDLTAGESGTAVFSDLANIHRGIEVDLRAKPTNALTVRGMVSLGNWTYADNSQASVFDDNQNLIGTSTLFIEDVKVGDAAQTTASIGADYEIIDGLSIDADFLYYGSLYADFDVIGDAFLSEDNNGALQLPNYNLMDAGITYEIGFKNGHNLILRGNVNNLFDTEYIAESNTNVFADASTPDSDLYDGIDKSNFVWFGFGRTWNASLRYNF